MIRMVEAIFNEAGIGPETKVRVIPPQKQNRAILNISREFLGRIRHIRPDGEKLFDVLDSFGKLSKKMLYEHDLVGKGKTSRGKKRTSPYSLITIYVDDLLKASPAAIKVWERLQKASVFIAMGLAPSQRSAVADHVTLRRIYCPAFKTTLVDSERLRMGKEDFEVFMDEPVEYCNRYARRQLSDNGQPELWDIEAEDNDDHDFEDDYIPPTHFPRDEDRVEFKDVAPDVWRESVDNLPNIAPSDEILVPNEEYDLYIAAMGFESRTVSAIEKLLSKNIRVDRALLIEYELENDETEMMRDQYEEYLIELGRGRAHQPVNVAVGSNDPYLYRRIEGRINRATANNKPKILFDCSSCASLIHSTTLAVLLSRECELTILYSEAEQYHPSKELWESGKIKPSTERVRGPFGGFRFAAKPPMLQSDDTGEYPVCMVLIPAIDNLRTDGVLAELDPASRIWLFGSPHDEADAAFRIDMAKEFTSTIMHEKDPWSIISAFNYKDTLTALGGIYAKERKSYRLTIMPHGTKMQTLATNIFAQTHDISLVFAMPLEYDASHYSKGCKEVWGLHLGNTHNLMPKLKIAKALGR